MMHHDLVGLLAAEKSATDLLTDLGNGLQFP